MDWGLKIFKYNIYHMIFVDINIYIYNNIKKIHKINDEDDDHFLSGW
jgi:hypothetical protein